MMMMMTTTTKESFELDSSSTIVARCELVFAENDASDRALGNPVLQRVLHDLKSAKNTFGDNHNSVADAWNALGLVRVHTQRDVEEAVVCHQEAYRIFIQNGEKEGIAFTLNDLAYCYELLGKHNKALSLHHEALSTFEETNVSEFHPKVVSTHAAISRIQRR
jgi:tetratricopeptide (TPR) repeat protein